MFASRLVAALAIVLGAAVSGATASLAAEGPTDSKSRGAWVTVGGDPAPGGPTFPAVGSFRARQATRLGVQVSGRVQTVLVDVGDVVTEGQELLKLDPEFFRIEVVQRQAELDASRASLQEAEQNQSRMKSLFDKPAGEAPSISRKQYDDSLTQFAGASARARGAEGALEFAKKRLDESVVRAPFNAVVTKRMVDPGEPVNSAPITYVLEVQEVELLDLEFSLPQELLDRVRKGTPLTYEVEGVANGRGRGTIGVIYPALDEATRSFRCRATVENPDLRFKPGMLAHVNVIEGPTIPTSAKLTVPRKALTWIDGGWQVRVDQQGKPVSRSVRVGQLTDQQAEIQDGLKIGERVWVPSRS
jgi:membrane fusion protein, multidrug efflux system